MLGIPGETLEDMYAVLRFAKKLNPDWCQFNVFVACPGSALYEGVAEKGLYDCKDDFLLYVKTDVFDYGLVLRVQKYFHQKFHRNPVRIIRKVLENVRFSFDWRDLVDRFLRRLGCFWAAVGTMEVK